MNRLPRLDAIEPESVGWGFFLCVLKLRRPTRGGEILLLTLQDASGQVTAKILDNVEQLASEFASTDYVKVEAHAVRYQGKLELIVSHIRRVIPDHDRLEGFREEECVLSAPRSVDEMWAELESHVQAVGDRHIRVLLNRVLADHGAQLRESPAAQTVHHAYRGGLLEHSVRLIGLARGLARAYDANEDLVIAGGLLHDIGKLQELDYDRGVTSYSRDGNLVGHIGLGLILVREMTAGIAGFPTELRAQLEHLVLAHHGAKERGSPVEPKTPEAFILAAVDDLDATLNQVRRAIREDSETGEFTAWHRRLGRVLYKGN